MTMLKKLYTNLLITDPQWTWKYKPGKIEGTLSVSVRTPMTLINGMRRNGES